MQHTHPQAKMSHAEVIAFVLISALYFQGNYKLTRLIALSGKFFSSLLCHSRIICRIHNIPESVWLMVFTICHDFIKNRSSEEYIVDSFAVPNSYELASSRIFKSRSLKKLLARGLGSSPGFKCEGLFEKRGEEIRNKGKSSFFTM